MKMIETELGCVLINSDTQFVVLAEQDYEAQFVDEFRTYDEAEKFMFKCRKENPSYDIISVYDITKSRDAGTPYRSGSCVKFIK